MLEAQRHNPEENRSIVYSDRIPIPHAPGQFLLFMTSPTKLADAYAELVPPLCSHFLIASPRKNHQPLINEDAARSFFLDRVTFQTSHRKLRGGELGEIKPIQRGNDDYAYGFFLYARSIAKDALASEEIKANQPLGEKVAKLQRLIDSVTIHEFTHLFQFQTGFLDVRNYLAIRNFRRIFFLYLSCYLGIDIASGLFSAQRQSLSLLAVACAAVAFVPLRIMAKNGLSRMPRITRDAQNDAFLAAEDLRFEQNKPFSYSVES